MTPADARQHSPAAERNRQPILDVLKQLLPSRGSALEIASGTGQHAVFFAAGLPGWRWQPSDPQPQALASISAWAALMPSPAGLQSALRLDVTEWPWPVQGPFDAIFCANMLHIAPPSACAALMRGAAANLAPQGMLITYGPYLLDGQDTAPSNLAFDADLRARHPGWGIRRLGDVAAQASLHGLTLREQIAMPSNNLVLVFEGGQG